MKRYMRWMAALVVLLLCVSLCGCDRLDELQETHAVWQEDGSILWGNAVYKPLPDMGTDLDVNTLRFDGELHVTDPDVPVLLSEDYGLYFDVSKDKQFINGSVQVDEYSYEHRLFCREDQYDALMEKYQNGFVADRLCYNYYNYETGRRETYYLTVEQEEAFYHVIQTVTPYTDVDYNLMQEEYLKACDEDDLYRQDVCTIAYFGNGFAIIRYNLFYLVPSDYAPIFADILQAGNGEGKYGEFPDQYYDYYF